MTRIRTLLKLMTLITILWTAQMTDAKNIPNLKTHHTHTSSSQAATSPEQALAILKAGNERFIKENKQTRDYMLIAKMTSEQGQHPTAIVLSCVDSRSVPDIIFDQGLGNIFAARIAGNVISSNVLASMEFATKYAGAKLIVIMGHTKCGAVAAACSQNVTGHLKPLLRQIKPAVKTVEKATGNHNCADPTLIDAIAKQNVINQLKQTLKQSSIIRQLVKKHQIIIVGAMHDLSTGQVSFFDEHGKAL